ncbi:MAG: hypothetical protein ABSA92_02475 [Candidatus Bathyarchaeia archaeon]|jgi:hypothetical protein
MTESNYPKTSHLRLAEWRTSKFVTDARETFNRSCLARLVLTRTRNESEGGYRNIGFNNIVDRIWFVDGTFGDTAYGTPSGADYGSVVAEAETRHALEKLFESVSQNETNLITETQSDPREGEVLSLLRKIRENGFAPTAIIASIKQSLRFWEFRSHFTPSPEVRRGLTSPEGHFQNVPVHHCRLLPDGVILASDKTALGVLEVKQDFDIAVTDIPDNDERERIRREVPSLLDADFDEKVRVKGLEIVKASIRQINACALIKTSGTTLELKKYE